MVPYKIFFVVLAIVELTFSDCYFNRECPYQLYSSKTPYDTVRGDIRDVPALEGCEAISMWSLNRHGNRNPGTSVTLSIKNIAALKDDIIASFEAGTSELCAQDIDTFRSWAWNETIEVSASYLTGTGYEELYDLAQRIRQKYPQLLETTNSSMFYFRPTVEQRTVTSAMAFVHGLSEGTNLTLSIDDPWVPDMVIRPYNYCDRYTLEVRSDDSPGEEQLDNFQETSAYTSVQNAVQKRLGISYQLTRDDVYYFYEICRFYRSWTPNLQSPWCSVFSNEDLVVLEYRDDIRHYYRNGYASWTNANLGRPAVKDLYESFVAAMEGHGRQVTSYFTHDTMLQMTFSALGLYKDDFTLVGDRTEASRLWRTSYIAAFSTNIIAVLNRCGDSSSTSHRVQIFINEKESALCPQSGCTWEEFQQKFQPYTDANVDWCDLNYTGPLPDTSSAVAKLANTGLLSFLSAAQALLYCFRKKISV